MVVLVSQWCTKRISHHRTKILQSDINVAVKRADIEGTYKLNEDYDNMVVVRLHTYINRQ